MTIAVYNATGQSTSVEIDRGVDPTEVQLSSGDFIMILDDECAGMDLDLMSRHIARASGRQVIAAERTSAGLDVLRRSDPLLIFLDIGFGPRQQAGFDWLADVAELPRRVKTIVYPFSQFKPLAVPDRTITAIENAGQREIRIREPMPKSFEHEFLADKVLSDFELDSRHVCEMYVTGVDSSTRYVQMLIPAWSLSDVVVLDSESELFDVDLYEFWNQVARGGVTRTLVLSGRADLSAEDAEELRIWVYDIVGELPSSYPALLDPSSKLDPRAL